MFVCFGTDFDLFAQLRRKITDGVIAPPLTLLLLLGSQPGVIN